ncbi:MAG: response regulator [Elusimicrobia bacterium]|nr:response regulator [Elusimicrobiota bacterium]
MKKILIADDDVSLVEILKDELEEAGYKIITAFNGKDCFKLMETTIPDLLILDIKLSGMSGLEILEGARHKFKNIPIIMCTAYDSFKTDYEVWASRIADYIVKPVDLDELKEKISKILGE